MATYKASTVNGGQVATYYLDVEIESDSTNKRSILTLTTSIATPLRVAQYWSYDYIYVDGVNVAKEEYFDLDTTSENPNTKIEIQSVEHKINHTGKQEVTIKASFDGPDGGVRGPGDAVIEEKITLPALITAPTLNPINQNTVVQGYTSIQAEFSLNNGNGDDPSGENEISMGISTEKEGTYDWPIKGKYSGTFENLSPNTTYWIKGWAKNEAGETYTNPYEASTLDPTPKAITNLKLVPNGNQLKMSFNSLTTDFGELKYFGWIYNNGKQIKPIDCTYVENWQGTGSIPFSFEENEITFIFEDSFNQDDNIKVEILPYVHEEAHGNYYNTDFKISQSISYSSSPFIEISPIGSKEFQQVNLYVNYKNTGFIEIFGK